MIKVEFSNGEIKEFSAKNVKQLLKELNIKENTVIVIRDDELLTEDDRLLPGDKVKIVPVVSGG